MSTTPEPNVDVDAVIDELAITASTTTALLNRLASRHDLSLTQLRVFGILRDRRARAGDLADHLGLERSTLSGLIDRAAARGLLQRIPNEDDRRVVEIELTARGRQFAQQLTAEVRRDLGPIVERLSAGDQRRLRALLERLNSRE